jgi:hypothetical protein
MPAYVEVSRNGASLRSRKTAWASRMAPKQSVIFVLLALWPGQAAAHDIYGQLTDRWGRSCCNHYDCRTSRYRATSSGVQMLIDGHWEPIPDEVIQYRSLPGDTGETGGGHWCGWFDKTDDHLVTRCAILPPGLTSSVRGREHLSFPKEVNHSKVRVVNP